MVSWPGWDQSAQPKHSPKGILLKEPKGRVELEAGWQTIFRQGCDLKTPQHENCSRPAPLPEEHATGRGRGGSWILWCKFIWQFYKTEVYDCNTWICTYSQRRIGPTQTVLTEILMNGKHFIDSFLFVFLVLPCHIWSSELGAVVNYAATVATLDLQPTGILNPLRWAGAGTCVAETLWSHCTAEGTPPAWLLASPFTQRVSSCLLDPCYNCLQTHSV